jgi:hypothetical protein
MMIAQFIRFYPYTVEQVLDMFAKTFFSLSNAMLRVQAIEQLERIKASAYPHMESIDQTSMAKSYTQLAKGNQGVLDEVRVIKGLNNGN